ncbi:glycosyltransferase [Enterobacter kobei]|uniref:glycosyltransferase n=1 Tax=Enterobacter cloacae complex TaxID=354276 RepID=UPI0020B16736|nr:glycosyltransferase [Enterobacter cloacae complex sp.]
MRIVYFVNAAWYFELHWLDRSEAAISKGYEVHLVSNFADDAIKNNLEKKGIKCWDIELNRFSKNVFKNISIFTAFRKICKQIKPDLIHLITIKPILFGGLYARVAGNALNLTLPYRTYANVACFGAVVGSFCLAGCGIDCGPWRPGYRAMPPMPERCRAGTRRGWA